MKRRFPFAAAVSVLGAMVCIAVLAFLAGCGGGGSGSADAQPQFGRINLRISAPLNATVSAGQTTTVEFLAAP